MLGFHLSFILNFCSTEKLTFHCRISQRQTRICYLLFQALSSTAEPGWPMLSKRQQKLWPLALVLCLSESPSWFCSLIKIPFLRIGLLFSRFLGLDSWNNTGKHFVSWEAIFGRTSGPWLSAVYVLTDLQIFLDIAYTLLLSKSILQPKKSATWREKKFPNLQEFHRFWKFGEIVFRKELFMTAAVPGRLSFLVWRAQMGFMLANWFLYYDCLIFSLGIT